MTDFSQCCGKAPDETSSKETRRIVAHSLGRDAAHHGGENKVQRCGHNEASVRTHGVEGSGTGPQNLKACPSDPLPSRLEIPQPSTTAPPTGGQVFNHMSLEGTFLVKPQAF